MKAISLTIISVVAALSLVGLGSALASGQSASSGAKVSTARTGLGRIIVDARGHTLYLFEPDRRGHSACSGTCAVYWPPLLTHGKPMAGSGAKQSLLGTIRRSNGARQVTYAGHPVYRYIGDAKRGQTRGQGLQEFGGGWDALTPAGKKIERGS
jgi:predicted lipoprotein with Yx(FWY)xxD motif